MTEKDYIICFSFMWPLFRDLYFDDETECEVIDTWNMEVQSQGIYIRKIQNCTGRKTLYGNSDLKRGGLL